MIREIDADGILREIATRARKNKTSIAKLCREAKIAPSTYQRWKNGSMSPTVDCLNILIRSLNQLTAS